MKATLTSKGQITIPIKIREKLGLKTGQKLEFDENAPFLKATKVQDSRAWEEFRKGATDHATHPWETMTSSEILNDMRGPVELPPPRTDADSD